MAAYKVCVVGGSCGNRMAMVAEHLQELFDRDGLNCRVTTHSVCGDYSPPMRVDLVLQLLQAFRDEDTGCPVINIRPMLVDVNDPQTLEKIYQNFRQNYPGGTALHPAFFEKNHLAVENLR